MDIRIVLDKNESKQVNYFNELYDLLKAESFNVKVLHIIGSYNLNNGPKKIN